MKMNRAGSRVMALLLTMVVVAGPLAVASQAEQTASESEEAWQTAAAPGLPDEQELFAGYVQRVFYGDQGVAPLAEHGEELFTGTALSLYRQLKEFVASVANGEQSSTLFKTTLRWEDLPQTQWTAQELGVDSIELRSGVTNPDALQAVYDIIGYDPNTLIDIVDCLLVDCPYDLYWFDKTGYSYSPSVNLFKEEVDGETMLVLYPTIAQVGFTVSENYAPADAADKFTIDTAKTGAAISAAANARQIVEGNAGLTDYEKLVAYRDKICELVDYNYDAAEGSDVAYGDPWQMIYVFDGNPSTKVVCEGYAKAFQYLFDQSSFTDDLSCRIVTGDMGLSQASLGSHMWNVVTMEDGNNYIVDITNSDDGMIGCYGGLFLSGGTWSDDDGGYRFPRAGNILYCYDSDTYQIYSEDQLHLTDTDYVPSSTTTPVDPEPSPVTPITSEVYPIEEGQLSMALPADVQTLLAAVQGTDIRILDQDGNPLAAGSLVGTGATLSQGDGEPELVVVYYGDLDGNGGIDASDLLMMRRALLHLITLEGAPLSAATPVSGEASPSAPDLLQMRRVLLRLADSMVTK